MGQKAIQLPDNDSIIAGYSRSFGDQTLFSFVVIRIRENGDLVWSKLIGDSNGDAQGRNLLYYQQSDDLYVGGLAKGFDILNEQDFMIVKLSLKGDLEWAKLYGGSDSSLIRNILSTSDGRIIVQGFTNVDSQGSHDILLMEI